MADILKKAQRDAYGEALAELGEIYPNMFVLDADLTKSTKTDSFKKKFPERHINCGIAEANMIAVAAGIASCGNIVFASSFAMFAAGRAFEQVRQSVGYAHTNVKIVATHAGLTVGEDGATHQCLEDLGLMRTIPGMIVLAPSDAVQTKAAVRFAAAYDGPVYIRLGRLALPITYEEPYEFVPGKSELVKDGKDATIMFCGPFYSAAVGAAAILEKNGLHVRVIDMPSIKPIDSDAVVKAAEETHTILTIEDHNIYGGLGSAVCEVVAENGCAAKVIRCGSGDKFGKSGNPEALLRAYGLDEVSIAKKLAEKICPDLVDRMVF